MTQIAARSGMPRLSSAHSYLPHCLTTTAATTAVNHRPPTTTAEHRSRGQERADVLAKSVETRTGGSPLTRRGTKSLSRRRNTFPTLAAR